MGSILCPSHHPIGSSRPVQGRRSVREFPLKSQRHLEVPFGWEISATEIKVGSSDKASIANWHVIIGWYGIGSDRPIGHKMSCNNRWTCVNTLMATGAVQTTSQKSDLSGLSHLRSSFNMDYPEQYLTPAASEWIQLRTLMDKICQHHPKSRTSKCTETIIYMNE